MTTHDPIPARLAALKTMAVKELKAQWRELYGTEPPLYNRPFLESRLAYRIQELAYGGLKPATLRRLEQMGEELLAVSVDDDRLSWPERELVRQLGDRLYGTRHEEKTHG